MFGVFTYMTAAALCPALDALVADGVELRRVYVYLGVGG